MYGRRNPFVAKEGLPLLALALVAAILLIRQHELLLAMIPAVLFMLLYGVFRDPRRSVPSVALGVCCPVDGEVTEVSRTEAGATGAPALRIVISVDILGTYTARAPVEGSIGELGKKALWLQTDEGEDVVLKFSGYRLGMAPRAFVKFGERLGQGQRCAYLRLTRTAEVQLPVDGMVFVQPGQTVVAGTDIIANVRGPR